MSTIHRIHKPRKELNAEEVEKLLLVTGHRVAGWRDHVLYSLAIGSGMREHELEALDWDMVLTKDDAGQIKIRTILEISVFKGDERIGGTQTVRLPPDCQHKLYIHWRRSNRRITGPVFMSRENNRLSRRAMRHGFKKWQAAANLERHFTFHSLRHTFCRLAKKAAGNDLTQLQELARHRRIETTMTYAQPGEIELAQTVQKIRA